MEKTDKQIREEINVDYADKSTFKVYCILFLAHILRSLLSEVFIFIIFYIAILFIPFILWLFTGDTPMLLLALLIAIPVHYIMYTFTPSIREVVEDEERIQLRDELNIGIDELKAILKSRKN
ncbi:MAG: hypothetical protein LW688_02555 [Cryomorphaceae bacterium]|nr:hypothetical protein [Cryomorphaceae bacterium]